jgi:hypothetical protein
MLHRCAERETAQRSLGRVAAQPGESDVSPGSEMRIQGPLVMNVPSGHVLLSMRTGRCEMDEMMRPDEARARVVSSVREESRQTWHSGRG